MYNEDERRDGRFIMRVTMAEESDRRRRRQERGYEDWIEQSVFKNMPELLLDRFNSHLANRHFSDAEREWINVRYGNLKTFLDWFRFRLYEPDERKEAKKKLQWLMWIGAKLKEVAACYGTR
jgi:cyclopropane fatty-acyl-phospholipid synthase-like methyltransferase